MSVKNLSLKKLFVYFKDWKIISILACHLSLITNSSTIKLYKGVMCLVLHMARCTNVIRLGHLALRSGVASGWRKTLKIETDF